MLVESFATAPPELQALSAVAGFLRLVLSVRGRKGRNLQDEQQQQLVHRTSS